jgi:hypothetical protein
MRANLPAFLLLCVALWGAGCSASADRKAHQAKPAPPLIEFIGQWGTKGIGPGLLDQPRAIATDEFAAVYLADAGVPSHFINKFTRGGHPLQSFEPTTQIKNPCAGAVDRGGAIYVLECGAGVLYLFSPEGKFLHSIRGGITASAKPSSVAVDNDGRIYVAESGSKRVLTYTPLGHMLGSLGAKKTTPNNFIGADQVAASPDGGVYVSDSARQWIARIASDGSIENSWTWTWTAEENNQPGTNVSDSKNKEMSYLAVTPKYVVLFTHSPSAPSIHVFSPDGREEHFAFLKDLDSSLAGVIVGGVAVTPDGELVVLDTAVPRVLRFRLNF